MKKGFIVLAIGLWMIAAIAIIAATVLIANGRGRDMLVSNIDTLIKSEEISLGSIENINIESSRQSIQILKANTDSIKISHYGNPNALSDGQFLVSTTNDSIRIYFKNSHSFKLHTSFLYNERLVIEIPETFSGNFKASASSGSIKIEDAFVFRDVRLNSTSGSIKINNNITADTLNVKASSGSIKFNGETSAKSISARATSGSIRSTMGITSEEGIEFETSSGSINAKGDITARDLYAQSSSGGIHMSYVYVESFSLECTSGSISAESISGGGAARTSSGSIRLALNTPKGDIDLNSTSGSIKISLEPSLQFTLNANTTSGGIRTNFNTYKNERGNSATANIGDSPTVNITARASSGGIRIEN